MQQLWAPHKAPVSCPLTLSSSRSAPSGGMTAASLALYRAILKEARQFKVAPFRRKVAYNSRHIFETYRDANPQEAVELRRDGAAALRVLKWLRQVPEVGDLGRIVSPSPVLRGWGRAQCTGMQPGMVLRCRSTLTSCLSTLLGTTARQSDECTIFGSSAAALPRQNTAQRTGTKVCQAA